VRRTSLVRRLAAATAAPLLALTLVSCGGSGGTATSTGTEETSSPETPSAASSSAAAEESAAEDGGDVGDLAEGDTVTAKQLAKMLGQGVATYTTLHMTVDGTADGKPLRMEADIDARNKKSPAMRMTMESGRQTVEMILLDGALYLGNPKSGDPYVKFASPKGQVPFGLDKQDTSQPGGGFVDDKEIASATYLGEDDVNGVTARHFSIEGKGDMKDAELWIDGEGRVIQIVGTVDGDTATISLSKFGEKVSIKAPKNVQDLSSFGQ
jgi:hypothetical protein